MRGYPRRNSSPLSPPPRCGSYLMSASCRYPASQASPSAASRTLLRRSRDRLCSSAGAGLSQAHPTSIQGRAAAGAAYIKAFEIHLARQRPALTDLAHRANETSACLVCFEADFRRCHPHRGGRSRGGDERTEHRSSDGRRRPRSDAVSEDLNPAASHRPRPRAMAEETAGVET